MYDKYNLHFSLFSSFYLCLIFPFVGYCLAAYLHQRQIDTKIVTFVKQFCFGREQQQEDNVVESSNIFTFVTFTLLHF